MCISLITYFMKILTIAFLLILSNPAGAAEPTFTKQYANCIERDESGSPMERIDCMVSETKKHGAILEATYKTVLKETPKQGQAKLREAQRDWLKYLASNCDSFYDAGEQVGGMLAREEARADCVMNMTRDRKENLKALLETRTM
ncbi:lysozyme inhibitor LprI family protein [Massilia sp.]|uniref:lysozyme inhibitor LprI family protein n=1 Tax=Massilia sp. TaxID=1882437 RepID=UPI0028AE42FB|nr:lysozyme inhibitor LprI family protein [Massilia sp.]